MANLFRGMEQHTPWHFANASVEPQDAKIIYYSPSCAPIEEKRSQACDETLKFLDLSESTLEWKAVLHEASYILKVYCTCSLSCNFWQQDIPSTGFEITFEEYLSSSNVEKKNEVYAFPTSVSLMCFFFAFCCH